MVRGRSGVKFQNWAGTFGCSPELFFQPQSLAEIQQILALARQQGKRVKVVGGGHSPSDIACTDGFMIHMGNLNRVLQVDKEKLQVKVQAGILLSELNRELDKHGLALANLGAVSEVSAAGVIGTGTHNTGIQHGILPTQVVALSLLVASGEVLECSGALNPELFEAARLHLGALGVVLDVTFQCVPRFRLRQLAFPSTLTQVLDGLEEHLQNSQYFRFLWFPHTENVRVIYQDPTEQAATIPNHSQPFPTIPNHSQPFPTIPNHSQPFPTIPNHSQQFRDLGMDPEKIPGISEILAKPGVEFGEWIPKNSQKILGNSGGVGMDPKKSREFLRSWRCQGWILGGNSRIWGLDPEKIPGIFMIWQCQGWIFGNGSQKILGISKIQQCQGWILGGWDSQDFRNSRILGIPGFWEFQEFGNGSQKIPGILKISAVPGVDFGWEFQEFGNGSQKIPGNSGGLRMDPEKIPRISKVQQFQGWILGWNSGILGMDPEKSQEF